MKKLLPFILLLLLSLPFGCVKNDDGPQPHKDILRCKVNGEEWVAYDYRGTGVGTIGPGATDLLYYDNSRYIDLVATKLLQEDEVRQSIIIRQRIVKTQEEIPLSFNSSIFNDGNLASGCNHYELDTLKKQYLFIDTIDKVNYRMKGSFEFSAFNNCKDTVTITNGYFHLGYRF